MQIIRTLRILPALVVALVALFVVASGSAMASTNSGHHHGPVASAAHHKKKKPKKKKAPKPQAPKGPFVARDAGATSIGTGPDDTIVAQLSPGNGNYIVTATVELGNNAASANSVSCKLLQGFQIIGAGTEDLTPLATYSRTMTLMPKHRELLLIRIGILCRSEYEYAAHARQSTSRHTAASPSHATSRGRGRGRSVSIRRGSLRSDRRRARCPRGFISTRSATRRRRRPVRGQCIPARSRSTSPASGSRCRRSRRSAGR